MSYTKTMDKLVKENNYIYKFHSFTECYDLYF